MARPEDLVLYKVMPTRDIVKCSYINMTNARLISNRKHKLPSQHKFSALSCRRADRVDSGRRLHSSRPPCHLTPRTVREKHGEDTGRQWMQRSQRWWWKRDKRRDGEATRREDSRQCLWFFMVLFGFLWFFSRLIFSSHRWGMMKISFP